ncbi:hypothetical protein OR1_00118 [Geobacter sp. OR-1]|uniref:PulJ/GspJ family protein n=1 Tax=Geobacter sp. OR-1 TaxID=1266765 RepID=UPI000543EF3A|nr:prepilin-type N-terminal cleavage/methylation domain-containing protein [Geobacter sp. OR-1]GAM07849.1 hypothetical protein OR1_00118 [Geobacter sp. OR-1]
MRNNRGFTLIELVIAMALFIVVIMISASAFESILKTSGRLISSEESNIEGVVGLEMFRHDLMQMGFGLPASFLITPTYSEAAAGPDGLNDSPSGVPRPVVSRENYSAYGDYLAVKGSSVGNNAAAQKWTYMRYSSTTAKARVWPRGDENLDTEHDRVVILDRSFSKDGKMASTMVNATEDDWKGYLPNSVSPVDKTQIYYIYGVNKNNDLRMPFNRADYYVKRPVQASSVPAWCASNVGILYKGTVNHSDGQFTENPLVDCVADMQVVFGWDVAGTGVIDESSAYDSDAAKISVSGTATPAEIKAIMENPDEVRSRLKYVKIYIMAQDGPKDLNFTNSSKIVVGDVESLVSSYTVAALTAKGWLNYRWKIYRLVVRPKNLTGN